MREAKRKFIVHKIKSNRNKNNIQNGKDINNTVDQAGEGTAL